MATASTTRSAPAVEWYSSQSLGGLSNYWTAAVPRFAPHDFDDAARLDDRYRWPVRYEDLVVHYERAERLLTVTAGAPIPGVPANVARYRHDPPDDWAHLAALANRAGHGVGILPMARGRAWMIARRGTEFQSYQCVLDPLVGHGRLELRTGAAVTALSWNSGRVDGVEYVDVTSGERRTQRARAVVVAAGTIDSTVILLRSRSDDFPTGLGNTQGLVGRYLHDHPREWWVGEAARPMTALAHPMYIARRDHAASEPGMATSLTISLASRLDRVRSLVRTKSSRFGVQVFGTMLPTPEVGVRLPDGGVAGPRPRAVVHLRYDDATVRNLTERSRTLGRRVPRRRQRSSRARTLPRPRSGLVGALRRNVAHARCTGVRGDRRVEPDARRAQRRDRRHERLHDGSEKNPTLTAMALASRACDRLADDLQNGVVP